MGSSASTAPGTSTSPTSSDPTTTAPTDDTTTGDPLDCPSPAPQGLACQPPGTAHSEFLVLVDGRDPFETEYIQTCTLDDVNDDGTVTSIALSCEGGAVPVDLSLTTTDPHHVPELPVGEQVQLYYSTYLEDEAVFARHLSLRTTGDTLLLLAIDGSELAPPPTFDLAPLQMQVVPTDCPATPTECVYKQNAALEVSFDGDSAVLFDDQDAFIGPLVSYRIITNDVERIHCFPRDCGYSYAEWFVHVMAFMIPEG